MWPVLRIAAIILIGLQLLCASGTYAENLFVTPTGAGLHDGRDWSNAFAGFAGIVWGNAAGKLKAGDTLWIAGGSYGSRLEIKSSGTSTSKLILKRALAGDAAARNAAGWLPSFDAQVIINEPSSFAAIMVSSADPSGPGRHMVIDGRVPDGIRINLDDLPSARGILLEGFGSFDISFQNIGVYGKARSLSDPIYWNNDVRGIVIQKYAAGPQSAPSDISINGCTISGLVTAFLLSSCDKVTIERCNVNTIKCYSGDPHSNLAYVSASTNLTFRYNDFNNNQSAVGLFFTYFGGLSHKIFIYGNLFRDQVGVAQRYIELREQSDGIGPFYIYNNTFAHVNQAINLNSLVSTAGPTIIKNNLAVDVQSGGIVNVAFPNDPNLVLSNNLLSTDSSMFVSAGQTDVLPSPYSWQ